MTLEQIQKPTIHVLHHGDSDGRFAGYAAWRRIRNEAKLREAQFIEVQYGQPFPLDIDALTKNDTIFIVDFSYSREILDRVYDKVGTLVVLDHHETAEEQLRGAPYALYDATKSGALLAWEYFFPDQKAPMTCLFVNDRDLWQWKYQDETRAFEAWLKYDRVQQDWEKWDNLSFHEPSLKQALEMGKIIVSNNQSIIDSFVNTPGNIVVNSMYHEPTGKIIKYAIYNGNAVLISELAEKVYKSLNVDLTIDWRGRGTDMSFSLRSPYPEKCSARAFAEVYGGGGNPATAGMRMPLAKGMDVVKYLMSKI